MSELFASALIAWNAVVFLAYGIDKWKAVHNQWRIKERTLLLLAFLMGGAGAFLGMLVFRHKTRQLKFTVLVPLALAANAAVLGILVWRWMQ